MFSFPKSATLSGAEKAVPFGIRIPQVILVSGAGGQLGKAVQEVGKAFTQYQVIGLDKHQFPVNEPEKVKEVFEKYKPAYFVNCAAYTAVDLAETNPQEAFAINATAVELLATLAKEYSVKMIHISTDYVFDGKATSPYHPQDVTQPQTQYGYSKQQGELLGQNSNDELVIIRTAWVYATYGKNFLNTMLRLFRDKPFINVVDDQQGTPTYVDNLAAAIFKVIQSPQWIPGVFHYTDDGATTWYEFAVAIRNYTGSNCVVNPIGSENYPIPAKRPAYSVLDCSSFVNAYGVVQQPWQEVLEKVLQNR